MFLSSGAVVKSSGLELSFSSISWLSLKSRTLAVAPPKETCFLTEVSLGVEVRIGVKISGEPGALFSPPVGWGIMGLKAEGCSTVGIIREVSGMIREVPPGEGKVGNEAILLSPVCPLASISAFDLGSQCAEKAIPVQSGL